MEIHQMNLATLTGADLVATGHYPRHDEQLKTRGLLASALSQVTGLAYKVHTDSRTILVQHPNGYGIWYCPDSTVHSGGLPIRLTFGLQVVDPRTGRVEVYSKPSYTERQLPPDQITVPTSKPLLAIAQDVVTRLIEPNHETMLSRQRGWERAYLERNYSQVELDTLVARHETLRLAPF